MQRTLTVHIGPPKTGTSAIQFFFLSTPSTHIIYPRSGLRYDNAHHDLVFKFFRTYDRPDIIPSAAAGLLRRLRTEIERDPRDVLISSEVLGGDLDVTSFLNAL